MLGIRREPVQPLIPQDAQKHAVDALHGAVGAAAPLVKIGSNPMTAYCPADRAKRCLWRENRSAVPPE